MRNSKERHVIRRGFIESLTNDRRRIASLTTVRDGTKPGQRTDVKPPNKMRGSTGTDSQLDREALIRSRAAPGPKEKTKEPHRSRRRTDENVYESPATPVAVTLRGLVCENCQICPPVCRQNVGKSLLSHSTPQKEVDDYRNQETAVFDCDQTVMLDQESGRRISESRWSFDAPQSQSDKLPCPRMVYWALFWRAIIGKTVY